MRHSWPSFALVLSICVAAAAACSSAGGTSTMGTAGTGAGAGVSGEEGGNDPGDAGSSGKGETAGSEDPGGTGGTGSGGENVGGTEAGGQAGAGQAGAPPFGGNATAGDPFGNGGGGNAGAPVLQILSIAPMDAVFSPPIGAGLSAKYKALLKETGKPTIDVTAEATFSIEPPDMGSFSGATLSTPAGKLGKGTVKCSAKGLSSSTSVTIEQGKVVIGPGAPADAPGKFGGPSSGDAIKVVYPASGILVPPNMNSLEIHFIPSAGQQLFELDFQSTTVGYTVYTTCQPLNGGCVFAPDASFWKQMANGARGNAPVSFTVRGVDGAGNVGTSSPRTMQFAAEDLEGGIYYWSAQGVIMRYDFGYPGKAAEVYMNAAEAKGFTCVGCHSISRNGQKIAVGVDIPAPAPYRVFNVGSKSLSYPAPAVGSNFFAFNPDASQILISDGSKISWINANSGQLLGDAVVPSGTMPDWSPDGSSIVYARPATPPPFGLAAPGVASASLEVRPFNGSGFGAPSVLVPFLGGNNYYPSYSPDGAWVAFNRSPGNHNSFENASESDAGLPDGEVWIISSKGGSPIRLDQATQAGDSWPKWAIQTSSYEGGKVLWLTFSSRREYGLRLAAGKTTQLWMIGIDLARAAAGQDPSFPAFWLPFQSLSSGNHIAQWVTKIERKPCASPADCSAGQTCGPQSQCVPL